MDEGQHKIAATSTSSKQEGPPNKNSRTLSPVTNTRKSSTVSPATHNRNVSSLSNKGQGEGQGHHRRNTSTASNVRLGEDGTILSALSTQSTSKKIFTIKDVKSQFETEAEAAILRSIEQNERRARLSETDEEGVRRPSFLADIPADKVHLFTDKVGVNEEGQVEAKPQTTTSNLKFKSATRRLMMIQKITAASSDDKKSNIASEDDNDTKIMKEEWENNLVDMDYSGDIESQSPPSNVHDDEANVEEDEIKDVNTNEHKHLHGKGCYRTYCGPCQTFTNFVTMRRQAAWKYTTIVTILIASLLAVAAILFYQFENPIDDVGAAYSWYLLLFSKLTVTFTLAVLSEALLVDYLFLETKLAVMSIGRFLTLMTVQAKGWPLRIFFWAIWTFTLIIGDVEWKQHWLNFQDKVELFTSKNPGLPPDRAQNLDRVMVACIILGLSTMVKRALFAQYIGKKKYGKFISICCQKRN